MGIGRCGVVVVVAAALDELVLLLEVEAAGLMMVLPGQPASMAAKTKNRPKRIGTKIKFLTRPWFEQVYVFTLDLTDLIRYKSKI